MSISMFSQILGGLMDGLAPALKPKNIYNFEETKLQV